MLSNPNSPIVLALTYFPLTSPMMMLIRLGFGPVPAGQVIISLVLLAAGLAFCLWAGAKSVPRGAADVRQAPEAERPPAHLWPGMTK